MAIVVEKAPADTRSGTVSDEQLAARAATGDELAFEELVTRYHARVYRLACRLTGSDDDGDDVTQDAFSAYIATWAPSAASRDSGHGSTASRPTRR
jgi:RNA polymerase sigma-70 factor (ECF subfamily)